MHNEIPHPESEWYESGSVRFVKSALPKGCDRDYEHSENVASCWAIFVGCSPFGFCRTRWLN